MEGLLSAHSSEDKQQTVVRNVQIEDTVSNIFGSIPAFGLNIAITLQLMVRSLSNHDNDGHENVRNVHF